MYNENNKINLNPGSASGFPPLTQELISCEEITKRAIGDGLRKPDGNNCCPKGYHKVHLFVAEGRDYHWYRQDADGGWFHKLGKEEVLQTDSFGNLISNPVVAARDYTFCYQGGPDYDKDCGVLCAPHF